MLKLTSTFPVPLTIDGETVTIQIKRFGTPEEATEFLFACDRMFKEAQRPDADIPIEEQHEMERRHRAFVRESIEKYVTLQPGQLEDDGEMVTDGAGFVRAFASRQSILSQVLARIRLENTYSKQGREYARARLAPFVPTPPEVVEAMLDAAGIGEGDTIIDVGCGTGALLVAAAKRGATAVGYELNHGRAQQAMAAAVEAGVASRVHVHRQDAMTVPAEAWRAAKAVLMYLLPEPHQKLGATLKTALLPGARVVCHAYQLGDDWPPALTQYIPVPGVDNMTPPLPPRIDSAVGWVYAYEVR